MKLLRKIFEVPDSYRNLVNSFGKEEAFIAIVLLALYCMDMALSGILVDYVSADQITYIGGVTNLVFVGIILLILKVRKQGIETIGLRKGNIKLSLIMGIVLAVILYFFTVGLVEEVMFRGYIETRLHGYTKRIYIDIILTGILFLLMHYPFRIVAYNMSFWDLITNVRYMLDLFITHLILSFIRIKSDCLYGAIIPHWISDLAYRK